MLANFHTHTSFCDGKNTPEEIVLAALEQGFGAIGFSGHGYTPFDLRYCMKDTEGYIAEVERLKRKYGADIQIYLGVEEDAFAPVARSKFDYIIGSSHYFCVNGCYFPIDSGYEYFKKCLEAFRYDVCEMAEVYYGTFCDYIQKRRPDIVGHFDLITKFDELEAPRFLGNAAYERIAAAHLAQLTRTECVFEVNTGAITRGLRSAVYPSENLLYLLKKEDAKLMLAADSHEITTLSGAFDEAKKYLYDIGFRHIYTISGGALVPVRL